MMVCLVQAADTTPTNGLFYNRVAPSPAASSNLDVEPLPMLSGSPLATKIDGLRGCVRHTTAVRGRGSTSTQSPVSPEMTSCCTAVTSPRHDQTQTMCESRGSTLQCLLLLLVGSWPLVQSHDSQVIRRKAWQDARGRRTSSHLEGFLVRYLPRGGNCAPSNQCFFGGYTPLCHFTFFFFPGSFFFIYHQPASREGPHSSFVGAELGPYPGMCVIPIPHY